MEMAGGMYILIQTTPTSLIEKNKKIYMLRDEGMYGSGKA